MTHHPRHSILSALLAAAAIAFLALLPAMSQAKGPRRHRAERWADRADERKADYLYMEAMRQNALEHNDAFFELLRRSHEMADPSDTQPGLTLGYYLMALAQEDSVLARKGYEMMRTHFDSHPEDYYSAIFYGMVNNELGNNDEALRVWGELDRRNPGKPDVALRYAQALQQSRDSANLRRSIEVLDRIQRAEGKSLGLYSNKISSLMALRDTSATLAEVDSLLASSRGNASNMVYAGDVMMALGRPDSAIHLYDRACAADPTNGLPYYKRAQYYRERGDSAAFDREVVQAVKQDGLDIDVKAEIMRTYVVQLMQDSLQRPRIVSLFDTLLLQHPHEAKIHDLYASYLVAVDDFQKAAEQQEYVLDDDPSQQQRWLSTISLYSRADDNEKALSTARRALRYLPDDPMVLLYAGNALSMLEKPQDALGYLHQSLDHVPADDAELRSAVLATIGDNLYKLKEVDSALVYYDRALEANPDNLLALNNCAYFMAEQGRDLDKAERMSSICVRQQPDNDTAIDTFAWILFKQRRYAEAKEQIDRALAIEGDKPQADVLHHAGDIYYMNGDHKGAVDFWQKALDLNPSDKLLQKKVRHKTHFFE